MIKYICEQCGKEFSEDFRKHKKGNPRFCSLDCGRLFSRSKIDFTKRKEVDEVSGKCSFCGKFCKNQNSLKNHERLCKENANRADKYLYDKSDKWIKSMEGKKRKGTASNQYMKAKELGLEVPVSPCKGRPSGRKGEKLSERHKKKISESMKKVYRGKSIWRTQIENRKSYAEQYFGDIFTSLATNYYASGYFLDFANVQKKTYFEVDGEQHYIDAKIVEHDKVRTAKLEEDGWNLICRIRWSTFQKKTDIEKKEFIKDLMVKMT